MSHLTLVEARQKLWKYAPGANGTFIPYESAAASDTLAVDTTINLTIERFLTIGKWRGDTVRVRLKVYNDQVTLPQTLEAILGATPIRDADAEDDGCNITPYGIYSMYHEFLTSGPGNPSTCSLYGLVDLGDNFSTFIDPAGEFYLKAYSSTAETAKTLLLKGLDQDSKIIYTTGVEGVPLSLTTTPGVTTSQKFTALASWQKSATTTGVVRIYSVDTTSAEEQLLVIIPPGKTNSGYHRYRVPDGDWGDTIEALCKRAYVPAVADNDLIVPGNLGALKLGMMALQYEDKNDWERADAAMARAIDLLNKEIAQFQGDSVIPAVQFQRHFGASSVLNLS